LRARLRLAAAGAAVAAVLAILPAALRAADPTALWRIVHDQCVPDALKGDPPRDPCLFVDLKAGEGGDAVIKDMHGVAQLLDIPVTPMTGIEDARLLADGVPHYFADAWRARGLMARYLGKEPPREALSIAVNAKNRRSQDQLHLHLDCLRKDVVDALKAYAPQISSEWKPMAVALAGRVYWARRVDSEDLADVDPFRLLADGVPGARDTMGAWTLAAAPIVFDDSPGFVLLADSVGGHAEDLQDPDCAIAR
jgi:CDP-diacylglycerol pyrophosphatase